MKLLAIGVSKDFKTWSIPIEEEKVEDIDPTTVSASLYEDKENGGTVPSQIILVSVEDGAPVVKETWDAGDYN